MTSKRGDEKVRKHKKVLIAPSKSMYKNKFKYIRNTYCIGGTIGLLISFTYLKDMEFLFGILLILLSKLNKFRSLF